MRGDRFDGVLMTLVGSRTRRCLLSALTAAAAMKGVPRNEMLAATVHTSACAPAGATCKRKADCCTERCRSRKGKKKRRCSCSVRGARCGQTGDCCKAAESLACVSGYCI